MLDLNVLRSIMEHWFSLKASHSSDHYVEIYVPWEVFPMCL
jgi:hypothetical protein